MRLLTEEQIAGVCGRFARPENKKEGLHLLAEMAAEAEHKETLKAVGEWLNKYIPKLLEAWMTEKMTSNDRALVRNYPRTIEAIRHGEMPEGK